MRNHQALADTSRALPFACNGGSDDRRRSNPQAIGGYQMSAHLLDGVPFVLEVGVHQDALGCEEIQEVLFPLSFPLRAVFLSLWRRVEGVFRMVPAVQSVPLHAYRGSVLDAVAFPTFQKIEHGVVDILEIFHVQVDLPVRWHRLERGGQPR